MTERLNPAAEIATVIENLKQDSLAATCDPKLHYQIGVLLLGKYCWTGEKKVLQQARAELIRAIKIRPKHARSHAMLGYAYDLTSGGEERALKYFREAHRYNPRDKVYEVYLLTLLQGTGREQEALAGIKAAAPRHGVDIQSLRRDLKKSLVPTNVDTIILNGFFSARNYFESSVYDETESILNSLQPSRKHTKAATEFERCVEDQRELKRSFDASRVPEPIRALAVWASRYGVGDDVCRPYLLNRLSMKKRTELIGKVDRHSKAIQKWLDGFSNELMPSEAAAFMYLIIGVEEIRKQS